jgi:RNA polymerase-binding transcription factor DksA
MATKKKVAGKPTKKSTPKKPLHKKTVVQSQVAQKTVHKKTVPVKKAVKKHAPAKPVAKKAHVQNITKKLPLKNIDKKQIEKRQTHTPVTQKTVKPVEKTVKNKPKTEAKKAEIKLPTVPASKTVKKTVPASVQKPVAEKEVPVKRISIPPKKSTLTYQPEFTKSLLDHNLSSGPIYRYSDAELQEFKDLILKKVETAKKELVYLQGLITRKDEAGTDDTENKYMSMEDGSGTMEREQLNQMASRQIQFIDHLEKALMRIENKTYGICRETGKLIDKARLRAVPHATLSIEAKHARNK